MRSSKILKNYKTLILVKGLTVNWTPCSRAKKELDKFKQKLKKVYAYKNLINFRFLRIRENSQICTTLMRILCEFNQSTLKSIEVTYE